MSTMYKEDPHWCSVTGFLGWAHKVLGQDAVSMESDWSSAVMVVLVPNVGGAGGGVVDTGLPGIRSVLCDLEATGDGGREHVV